MSGISGFVLPGATALRWYQPQTVRVSFALDYMKPPSLFWLPQAPPSTKMSGMSGFVLPEATALQWYQPQTVRTSFPLDYMKPLPLGAPTGASFGGGLPDRPFWYEGTPAHLMAPSNIGPLFVPAKVLHRPV